jgi:hypothetical protein
MLNFELFSREKDEQIKRQKTIKALQKFQEKAKTKYDANRQPTTDNNRNKFKCKTAKCKMKNYFSTTSN